MVAAVAAKYSLKNDKGRQRNTQPQEGIIPLDQKIKTANQGACSAKHQSKAQYPEDRRTDSKIHQVFHNDIACVFARVKPVSTMAKPACIKKTSAAPNKTQIVFTEENCPVMRFHPLFY